MDWNWFFGALSQSAAAIVGIFGAFVITKILGNQSMYSQKLNSCRDEITQCQKIVDTADDLAFDWYNRRTTERELEDLNDLLEKDYSLEASHYYDKLDFSIFLTRVEAVQQIQEKISEKHATVAKERRKAEASKVRNLNMGLLGNSLIDNLITPIQSGPHLINGGLNLIAELNKERKAMDFVIREARHQIRVNSDRLAAVQGNPESSPQITYALFLVTILFFIGVIYPLSFLPAPTDGKFSLSLAAFWEILFTLKGVLLIITSAVFGAILIMFFWLNLKLKYPKELVEELDKYTSLSSFSHHFGIMEQNIFAGASRHEG